MATTSQTLTHTSTALGKQKKGACQETLSQGNFTKTLLLKKTAYIK
jgi:hypothetical protein